MIIKNLFFWPIGHSSDGGRRMPTFHLVSFIVNSNFHWMRRSPISHVPERQQPLYWSSSYG